MARSFGGWIAGLSLLVGLACGPGPTPDAGAGDAGNNDAGCACGALVCLGDGGCGECAVDQQCPSGRPVCDPARSLCVGCRASPQDSCPAGAYCEADQCVVGCKEASDCLSGQCLANHDCQSCQSDLECGGARRCGTGQCAAPCPATACGPGLACCQGACVDLAHDVAFCGQCTQACGAAAFCGKGACHPLALTNVCQFPLATALRDGQPADDNAGLAIVSELATRCDGGVTARSVDQNDGGVLAPNGAPLRSGELLAAGGGSFRQRVVHFLETNAFASVIDTSTTTTLRYSLRDGGTVAQFPLSAIGPAHDVFVVQLVRTPNGAMVLNAAGAFDNGTTAAAFYLTDVLLPTQMTLLDGWFVVEWTDTNMNTVPDAADTFTLLGSGR